MVDNFRLTVDSNTEIEPLETVRDVRMKGQSLVDNRVATIPQMTGATSSSNGSAGVVPTPSVGDREKFLRGDGTWAEASGGGGSNVSVDQILDDGVNIMDITIDNVTTHIYAPESDPNAVVDVVDANGDSLVDEYRVAHVEESVTDVVDANGDSLVDANGVAHVTGEVVDVVNGDGDSLVDENGIAHVTGDITDVLYDNKSVVNEDGVAELFSDRKITTLPLLDYENETVISGSATWRDTTVHRWTAPCDCVVYIFDQAGSNDTFVRYTIDDFVYYGTVIGRNHNAPYGLCSNFLPVKKGQEITIQLLGQMMNNLYNKAYYIPYKTVDENANDFPLPYLDHDNKISIDYSVTSFTAQTDGVVVDYGNGVNTIKITVNGFETTYYGKGGSQYFDCNVPVSTGDVVTLGKHSGKYFIPFKRTDNINKLVSPIPDYANRVVYSGDTLPTSFGEEGFLFLCAHDFSTYLSGVSVDYIIDSQNTLNIWAYKYAVSGTNYWKDSFAPINKTMTKSYASTGNNVNYYFIPYSKFESQYVKDVQVKGTSIVKAGGIANIESMVTDVQNPKGESLVGEGGIATVSGKVFDVQLEGISILDENAVANLKSNMGTFVSPILDYDRIGFVEESKTWIDRNPHNWTAPCDCVVFSCSPNGYGCVFSIDGEFTYKAYKNALGNYNGSAYASYYSMLPVAEGSVVTFSQIGQKDTTASYKMAYIPYKKATTLQSTYTLPYLDYENKTAIEWASPILTNELICEYTAPVDGYVSIDLFVGSNTTPIVTYTVNNNSNVNVMTHAMEANYYPNGIILGKGDTVSIYDAGSVPTYTYTGNIYFTPFATTSSLREVVSPIPDYANLETLDLTDFPTTFDAGYIFNCAERQGDNLLKYCKITLSDSVKIYTKSAPYDVIHEYSYFPISGDETLVSVEYETNAGNVYYIPYSEVKVTSVLVSDVQVNGASVVDANGVAHITGGGGGSTVTVTPIQTTGTKIAEIDVDGNTSDIYAPSGSGGGSTVSVTQKVSSGENIASITVDGATTELYATNTTYSDFVGATSESAGTHGLVPAPTSEDRLKYLRANGTWGTPTNTTYSDFTGATSQAAGAHGLVPAPTTSDTAKFLKGDGTWGVPDGGSDVSVTQIQSTGTKIATVTIDGTDTDLYVPNGGGGGVSDLDDLDDVEITTPTNGQVLKYNSTSQKWENGTGGGGASDLDDLTDVDITSPTNGQVLKYNSATQKWENSSGGGSGGKRNIFSNIDTLILSSRYATGSLSGSFTFSMSETVNDWSTSATVFNSIGIDLTDYDELEFTVEITEQSDYGAFWLTISGTKYTWGGSDFPTIYENVDSLIKVTESGTYTVDVSELLGEYYIYLGGTTGKPAVAHGNVSNVYNGEIAGTFSSLYGVINGSSKGVIPNPEGEPTDTLNTIGIDGVIYDLPSGSGNVSDVEVNGISVVDQSGVANVITHKNLMFSQYETLTYAQKTDGTIYFVTGSDDLSIDLSNAYEIAQSSSVIITDNDEDSVTVTWNGANNIGHIYYITTPIDVTDITEIKYDLDLGHCYGGSTAQADWHLAVGLLSAAPTSIPTRYTDPNWAIYNDYDTADESYEGEILNTNELSGYYYLVVYDTGWTSILSNVLKTVINQDHVYYMNHDYAGSGNIETEIEKIYQSPSDDAEQTITLSAPMTDFDLLILNTNIGAFMQPIDTIGEESYLGGGNGSNYIWYSFDLTTPTILTKAYQGGGVWIRNIQGVKFGGGNANIEELSLIDYENLTNNEKNDGTVRFIPHNDNDVTQDIDMDITVYAEGSMSASTTNQETSVVYSGGQQIGCNINYITPIDVTEYDKIIADIVTMSCYGSGSQAQKLEWDLQIGLRESPFTGVVNVLPTDSSWVVVADMPLSNHDYSGTELDVSGLTGEYYLCVSGHGWNATISDIKLAITSGYPSQIKYMSETYGISNIKELTEGEYNDLSGSDKNNGTVYFTYDGGYKYVSYDDGEIIVRVNTTNPSDCLWFFNGWEATALDNTIPEELQEYAPSATVAIASKGYGTSNPETQVNWIGFYNGNIRSWTTSWSAGYAGIIYGVVDIAGGQNQDNGYQDAYSYPTATPITPNHIYMNNRLYGGSNTITGTTEPTSADGNNGDLYFKIKSYQKVDYIGTTGGIKDQCIDTGIKFDENTTMDIDCEISSDACGNFQALCGWRNTQPYYGIYTRVQAQNVFAVDYNATSTAVVATDPGIYDERISVHCAPDEWTWSNGTLSYSQTFDFNGKTENMYLGSANFTGAAGDEQGKYKIYDFKVYKNNILENHFVPVLYNNHGAMVDVLTGRIYESINKNNHFSYGQTLQENVDVIVEKYVKVNGTWIPF